MLNAPLVIAVAVGGDLVAASCHHRKLVGEKASLDEAVRRLMMSDKAHWHQAQARIDARLQAALAQLKALFIASRSKSSARPETNPSNAIKPNNATNPNNAIKPNNVAKPNDVAISNDTVNPNPAIKPDSAANPTDTINSDDAVKAVSVSEGRASQMPVAQALSEPLANKVQLDELLNLAVIVREIFTANYRGLGHLSMAQRALVADRKRICSQLRSPVEQSQLALDQYLPILESSFPDSFTQILPSKHPP